MASVLKVDTLTGVTTAGSIAVTGEGNSTTTNLQQGLAKAFFEGNGTASSDHLGDSFNIASFVDNSTGNHSVTFTNNLSSVNYFQTADSSQFHSIPTSGGQATTGFGFQTLNSSNSNADTGYIGGAAHGDLA